VTDDFQREDVNHLEFEKAKWKDEIRFRQQEMDLRAKETEIKFKETEIKLKEQQNASEKLTFDQAEARRNRWTNPLVVAVFAAAVAAAGNAIVALLNGSAQRATEQVKDDQALILESIKANSDPDKAATNLKFLVETALISNSDRRTEIETFLKNRKQGEGPALPSATPNPAKEILPSNLFSDYSQGIGFLKARWNNVAGGPMENEGTCFVLSGSGYVLTTAHLISHNFQESDVNIAITISLGSRYAAPFPAQVVEVDKQLDIALLKMPTGADYKVIHRSHNQVSIGEALFVLGFPNDSELTLIPSQVSTLNEVGGNLGIVASIGPGFAGSPVFNKRGEAVGMVVSGRASPQGGVVVPVALAQSFFSAAGAEQ
jgi:S1-C subfamily serine protease